MIDSYPLKRKKHASGLPNITDELSLEANNVNPEQTDPLGAVWSGSTLFAIEAS